MILLKLFPSHFDNNYTLGNLKRNKMSVKINKVVMANRTPLDAYHSYEV